MKWEVYFGSYTPAGGTGIYRMLLDGDSGRLEPAGAFVAPDPSYLCLAHHGRTLYAVQERPLAQGGGGLAAFRVEETGGLILLNEKPSKGGLPCCVTTDPEDRFLYCANYEDGSASVYALEEDGSLGACVSVLRHQGAGPDPKRQQGPHMHCVRFSPEGRTVALCDLGLDRLSLLPFHPETGWGEEREFVRCAPGAGARHVAFAADGQTLYLGCEMRNLVEVYRHGNGRWERLQRVSTLPAGDSRPNTLAAVQLSPDGRTLTVSNRGQDHLASFPVAADGRLGSPAFVPSGGACPRDAAYSPDGRFLLTANQEGDTVAVFQVDRETGTLRDTGLRADLDHPSCVLFGRCLGAEL